MLHCTQASQGCPPWPISRSRLAESPRRLPAAPVPEAVPALRHPDVHRPQDGSGIRGRRWLAARARTWEGEEARWRGKVRGEGSGRGRGKGAAKALGSDVAEQRGDHGLHRRVNGHVDGKGYAVWQQTHKRDNINSNMEQ